MSSSTLSIVFRFLLAFQALFLLAKAEIYVTEPRSGSTCRGGEPCTVSWLENGRTPLLSSIGVVSVGLYTDHMQLVQALEPVDVSAVRAFTFTPNPAAGPNSGAYYIAFRSANPPVYWGYSPWFRLVGMTGSFESPLPSATETSPIPSSLFESSSTETLSTTTVTDVEPTTVTDLESTTVTDLESTTVTDVEPTTVTDVESTTVTSSRIITSRTPTPSETTTSIEDPVPSDGAEDLDGAAPCSTPVSNRVAISVTLVVALAFFLL